MAPPSTNDLGRAVEISEDLKRLGIDAFLMRLEATNAIIRTRSRGVNVPGFEAVAEQMGHLSRDLSACVAQLRVRIVPWIRAVSAGLSLERELGTLALAAAAAPHAQAMITAVMRPLEAERLSRDDAERARRELAASLDDARDLAATGCVVARTAKLEATYGGALADALAETAAAFTTLADAVDEAVRSIARRLGRTR
ncbi:MAG: hypothetical protein K8W52_05910 [Deltaproteobacteria bacterium]|nr:hypothetical protein [Deltaproteobacteria bacterium]